MQSEILLSVEDREAAQYGGCLSIFLWPPFSTLLVGAALLLGLLQISVQAEPASAKTQLASVFTPQVLYWESEIIRWSQDNGLDPNLVATVMQIESCGDPQAVSRAGAMGLFQVMPYHFGENENPYSPDTNAARGLGYLQNSLDHFNGNAALAFAGYNGGIAGASRARSEWAQETIDYIYWAEGIYADAQAGNESSPRLDEWLAAGGASLCGQAEQRAAAVR